MTNLAPLLETFFTDWLMRQRRLSGNTIAAYRDTFRLLLRFTQQRLGKPPTRLDLGELDVTVIRDFLDHLQTERHNSVRTRNARLAAIHSFFKFIAVDQPQHAASIQRILALPQKRCKRNLVTFLDRAEVEALLAAPDRRTWIGRRDHVLLLVAIETGLRVSELSQLRCSDVTLGHGANVHCHGKGRKERCTPLSAASVRVLKAWLRERQGSTEDVLFPSLRNANLSRDAIERLVKRHSTTATPQCPSLAAKRVTPHVLRHTTAVTLLQAGVDRAIIALWLGHEQIETTQIYLAADLTSKQRALARTAPLSAHTARYRPQDELLTFLESL